MPKKILIADDEPHMLRVTELSLKKAGYTIVTADDGDTAVTAYTQHRPALVVLDVTMPRVSGREAFRRIRAINPHARVLFSSGYTSEDVSSLSGPVGMLPKPYLPRDLLAAVRAALPEAASA